MSGTNRQASSAAQRHTTVTETLQTAANEIAALRLMSYTGGQADLGEDDVRNIRNTIIDLALLLSQATGVQLPEAEVLL
jgi:hypothetical protein